MSSTRFLGQRVIVTGGASGVGRATAARFAREGAHVCVLDLDGVGSNRVVQNIEAAGGTAISVQCDLRDGEAVRSAVREFARQQGGLDVLVSNAAVARHGSVPDLDVADWHLLLDVNLGGFFHASAAAIPVMEDRGGGAIVAVSSVHAFASSALSAAYAATKAGLVAMVRSMAIDHARSGIRINAVAPGSVDTPMLQASALRRSPTDATTLLSDWAERQPTGRISEPSEIASVIAFLASKDASAVTGACSVVDGGLLARLSL